MKTRNVGIASLLVLSALVYADSYVPALAASADTPITVTINLEARVSATFGGAIPSPVICGSPTVLRVKIVNQGSVTSRLEAEFVGSVPVGAALSFYPEPLTGAPEELRELRITLIAPGLSDLTVAFRSHNEAADIGGRDRVHFLMHCL
jgi:hypothetical protein